MKTCSKCGVTRPNTDYSKQQSCSDGLHPACKLCKNAGWNTSYRENGTARAATLRRYGLTQERFDQMLLGQGGVCAVCKNPESRLDLKNLSIDHDHRCCPTKARSCGACVRGLVCSGCNKTLGLAKDDPAILRAMAAYLERYH